MRLKIGLSILVCLVVLQASAQKLRVGVYHDYPLEFSDGAHQVRGIFISVLDYVAEQEKWQVEYKEGSYEQCLEWLKAGEIDIMPEYTNDALPQESTYAKSGEALLSNWAAVYSNEELDYGSVLSMSGKKVAVWKDSYFYTNPYFGLEHLAEELDLNIDIVELDSYDKVMEHVQLGYADLGLVSRVYGEINSGNYKLQKTRIIFSPVKINYFYISGFPHAGIIDHYIKLLKEDPSSVYYKALHRYFSPVKRDRIPTWVYVVMSTLVFGLIQLVLYVFILRRVVNSKTSQLHVAYRDLQAHDQALSLVYNNSSDLIVLIKVVDEDFHIETLPDWFLKKLAIRSGGKSILGVRLFDFYSEILKLGKEETLNRMQKLEMVRHKKTKLSYNEFNEDERGKRIGEVTLIPILDKGKRTCNYILFVSRDITEQMRMIEDLTETKNRLQLAIEAAREGMWDWDVSSGEVIYNSQQAKLLDLNDEFLSSTYSQFYDRLHPDDKEMAMSRLAHHLNTNTTFYEIEYRVKTEKRGYRWMQARGQVVKRDDNGNPLRIVGTHVDIDDRKNAELALVSNQKRLSTLISNLPGVVYRCNNDTTWSMTFLSEGIYALTGYTAAELIEGGVNFDSLILDKYKASIWKKVQRAIDKNEHFTLVYEIKMKSGEKKWVWEQGREVESGRLEGFISDITERMQIQNKIISTVIETEDKERKRIAKELHDSLGQKLTTVSLNFNALKKELNLGEDKSDKLETGLRFLKEAISDSRTIAHNLMPQSIEDFGYVLSVESLIADLSVFSSISFKFFNNLNGQRPSVNIELHLYRITQEAVNNVLKYAEATSVDIQLMKYDDTLVLTIEDDGKGFDFKQKIKTSDSFGLRSMKNRAESLSGTLEIDTSIGNGTCIIVEIPLE